MNSLDIESYAKLRPWTSIERCECAARASIYLVDLLTDNPIHCSECRREVDPQVLSLSYKVVDKIASARGIYRSMYSLWLDSGTYEAFAKEQLVNPDSEVNQRGVVAAKLLSETIPAYYWWFSDSDDGEPTKCPNCEGVLSRGHRFGSGRCEMCRVVI